MQVISAGVVTGTAKPHLDTLEVAVKASDAGATGRAAAAMAAAVLDALAGESLRRLPHDNRLLVLQHGLQARRSITSAWVVYLHNRGVDTSGSSISSSKGSDGGSEGLAYLQKGRESVALVLGRDLKPVLCVRGAKVQHPPGFIRNPEVRGTSNVEALLAELHDSHLCPCIAAECIDGLWAHWHVIGLLLTGGACDRVEGPDSN